MQNKGKGNWLGTRREREKREMFGGADDLTKDPLGLANKKSSSGAIKRH